MPRTLPANVAAVATAPGYQAGFAVEVLLASPIRVTDCPAGVTIGGNVFAYDYLQLGDTVYNADPALSILLGDAANVLLAADLADLGTGAAIGVAVNVYEVHWQANGTQLGPVTLLGGAIVAGYTADEGGVQITAQGSVEVSAGMVGRICSRNCMYVLKAARCGYAGATTSCAHTWNNCNALGNAARYGGYQTMPTLNTRLAYYVTSYVPASYRYGTTVPQTTATPSTNPTGWVRPRLYARGFAPVKGKPGGGGKGSGGPIEDPHTSEG